MTVTAAMVHVLEQVQDGRPVYEGISEPAAQGGRTKTLATLHTKRLLRDGVVTDLGRRAVAAYRARTGPGAPLAVSDLPSAGPSP